MNRPHFKIIANEGLGHKAKILVVDGDTEIDISELIGYASIDIEPGNPIWMHLRSPFAEVELIGYMPEDRLREFVSLGEVARRMLQDPV